MGPDPFATRDSKKWIALSKGNPSNDLKFVKLDKDSEQISVLADASFATSIDHTSWLGFVILLSDKFQYSNVLHYTSMKSKCLTRSAIAAELFVAVMVFNYASALNMAPNAIFGRNLPLSLYIDSKSLYAAFVGINTTTEKQLLIDFCLLR